MLAFQKLGRIAIATEGNRSAAEIQRPSIDTAYDFHTGTRLNLLQRPHRRPQCRHLSRGAILQRLHNGIDIRGIDIRFITLNIDEDVSVETASPGDLRNSVGPAGMLARHLTAPTELFHRGDDLFAVRRDDQVVQAASPRCGPPGVFNQGPSRLGQQ